MRKNSHRDDDDQCTGRPRVIHLRRIKKSSKRLGAAYVSSDLTRMEMDAQGRYTFEDGLRVQEEMAQRTAKHASIGTSCVL